jgi:hypothetical protein
VKITFLHRARATMVADARVNSFLGVFLCKKVIAKRAIKSFDLFFDKIEHNEKVISLVKNHLNSPRKTLRKVTEHFLDKWIS